MPEKKTKDRKTKRKTAPVWKKKLLLWYKAHARDLPWRRTQDPYNIWISEIMLQQTTVSTVTPYYERWVEKYPTFKTLASSPLQSVLKSWQGLGYYNRARNMHRTAQIICERYDEKMPRDYDTLKKLPGFGPYTTGAVLSIAYDRPVPIIDANVRRVMMRLLGVTKKPNADTDKFINKALEKLHSPKGAGTFNQALMELGALLCKSNNPLCLACPIKKSCTAYHRGIQEIIPPKIKKIITHIDVACAVIIKNNRFFLQKRGEGGLLAGLWEFPGGKLEERETPKEAVVREIAEEINCKVVKTLPLVTVRHFYTNYSVKLHAFLCELESYPRADSTHQWIKRNEFSKYALPSGNAKIVDYIVNKKI